MSTDEWWGGYVSAEDWKPSIDHQVEEAMYKTACARLHDIPRDAVIHEVRNGEHFYGYHHTAIRGTLSEQEASDRIHGPRS